MTNWMHHAACRDQPPDLFHPINQGDHCPEAQRICAVLKDHREGKVA